MNLLGIDIGGTSIKAALLRPHEHAPDWVATSPRYQHPTIDELACLLRDLICNAPIPNGEPLGIGLCAPGLYDQTTGSITRAINLPCLVSVPLAGFVRSALPSGAPSPAPPVICSDALAAATDFQALFPARGRLLALSLGTGIGAAVLDNGQPLVVSGNSPGHFGQMDVSIEAGELSPPLGPDGGRGGLEGYIGLPAIIALHGPDPEVWLASLKGAEPELRALTRAIRIAHAIYRPERIALLGGVGSRLRSVGPVLHAAISHELTSLARPGWELAFGTSGHHAASGAARIAGCSTPKA